MSLIKHICDNSQHIQGSDNMSKIIKNTVYKMQLKRDLYAEENDHFYTQKGWTGQGE